MLMPGKLTVDPIASFPPGSIPAPPSHSPPGFFPSHQRVLFFFTTAEPGKSAPSTRPPEPRSPSLHRPRRPSYRSSPIHPSLGLAVWISPTPKGHCTNTPEVAGARQKNQPHTIHPSQRATRVLHAQPRFFSQPASLVQSKPTRAVNHSVLQVAACVLCDCYCCCHPLVDRGPVACFWSRPSFLLPP